MLNGTPSNRGQVIIIIVFAAIALVAITGLAIDGLRALGWPVTAAYQGAYGLMLAASVASGLWFHARRAAPAPAAAAAGSTAP